MTRPSAVSPAAQLVDLQRLIESAACAALWAAAAWEDADSPTEAGVILTILSKDKNLVALRRKLK